MQADRAATKQVEAGGMWRGLGDIDRIVHPHGAVQGRGMETTRRSGGEGHLMDISLLLRGTRRVEGTQLRRRPTHKKSLDGAHQDVVGGAEVANADAVDLPLILSR
jgi:hypothetical protein